MTTEEALRDTAVAFTSYAATIEPSAHISLRAANCIHIFAPSSVNPPSPMTNENYAAHLARLKKVISSFSATTKEIHINVPKHQALIWANVATNFKDEVKGLKEGDDGKEWDYVGEYMFLLDMDEWAKITRVVEFLDSLALEKGRALMRRAWKNAEELSSSS